MDIHIWILPELMTPLIVGILILGIGVIKRVSLGAGCLIRPEDKIFQIVVWILSSVSMASAVFFIDVLPFFPMFFLSLMLYLVVNSLAATLVIRLFLRYYPKKFM